MTLLFEGALPRIEEEDRRLFLLLKRGYIEARYSKSYKQGFDRGKDAGLSEGFNRGKDAGLSEGFDRGKDAGLSEGFDRGKDAGSSEGFDRGKEAGVAEGQVRAVLSILAARGVAVGAEERARIEACRDPDVLRGWVIRAVSVASVVELFTPEAEEQAPS